MSCRSPFAAQSGAAILLLTCQLGSAWGRESAVTVAVASAQSERGLAYLDAPLAEAALSWWNERGWSAGVSGARTLRHGQSALAAHAGYGWPLATQVDAYVALGYSDYRRADHWRYRYAHLAATVNVNDRLFVSVRRLFDARMDGPYSTGPVAATVAKELVWRQPLPAGLTLVAGAGHAAQRGQGAYSYWYGNVGLRAVVRSVTLDASYIATDAEARRYWGSQAGKRWVASARWEL